MPKVKGMFIRRRCWLLRFTPTPGLPQVRMPLRTSNEIVAAARALEILRKPQLQGSNEFLHEMEEYLEDSIKLRRMAKGTAVSRRKVLAVFAEEFRVRRLSDLTTAVVERWVELLQGGGGGKRNGQSRAAVAPSTVVSYVFHLRAFCRWLVKKNKMHENPAAKVELGKVELVVRKNFERAATVRALIDSAADDDMRFIYYCGFHAGMRKLEIIEARPDWFRLGDGARRGIVNIHRTPTFSVKDRDERTVPLSSEFEAFLRKYLGQLPADAEFVLQPNKKHAKAKYRYDFRAPFAAHMKAMKVKCTPHDMRRTFVSLKIIEDSSLIFKLAKWTGTNVKTLQAPYAHLLADDEDIEVGLGDARDPDANLPRYLKSFEQLVEKTKRMSESGRAQFFARLAKALPQQYAIAA